VNVTEGKTSYDCSILLSRSSTPHEAVKRSLPHDTELVLIVDLRRGEPARHAQRRQESRVDLVLECHDETLGGLKHDTTTEAVNDLSHARLELVCHIALLRREPVPNLAGVGRIDVEVYCEDHVHRCGETLDRVVDPRSSIHQYRTNATSKRSVSDLLGVSDDNELTVPLRDHDLIAKKVEEFPPSHEEVANRDEARGENESRTSDRGDRVLIEAESESECLINGVAEDEERQGRNDERIVSGDNSIVHHRDGQGFAEVFHE